MAKLFLPFKSIFELTNAFNDKEKTQFFNNTIQEFKKIDIPNNPILKNALLQLCKHDKILEENSNKYFYFLSILLKRIENHKEAIKKYRHNKKYGTQIEKGISASHSTSNEKIVTKRQNSLQDTIALNPHDKVANSSLNIINEFIKNPYEVNLAVNQTTMLFSKEDLPTLTEEEYQTLNSTGTYLDCDKYISSENIFYESLAATISHYYNSQSYWQKIVQTDPISNQELSEIVTVIIQHVFECDYTISASKLKSPIQIRCMYGNLLSLYEFQTEANTKIHPVLVDNEDNNLLFEEFYNALQGKIPQKDS